MEKIILGKKIGMTQILKDNGDVVAVTVIQAGPCQVTMTKEVNGHKMVQIGFGTIKDKHLNKPLKGHFKKQGVDAKKYLKEYKIGDEKYYAHKAEVKADIFKKDEIVNVRSKTIGRGFTGTIKRHNFHRGPMTHGSKSHRIAGSVGAGTSPGHVVKGKRMSGHYGDAYVTIKNLQVVDVDSKEHLIFIKGAIPGKRFGLVEIFN